MQSNLSLLFLYILETSEKRNTINPNHYHFDLLQLKVEDPPTTGLLNLLEE
jgi:hypothetical protein